MGFNIADVLKDVPELDTGREQIEYIALALIDGDSGNFYSLSEIESLANNIATIGLQQPLRLRKNPTEEGRYLVVSGHRRREALMLLAKEEPERWNEVACIVQCDTVSPAMQQLRLIFANSDTRKMSSADISEQAVQVEKLLYQLKEEGHEFPGRMRDHVAQVVQVSKTKLARLKVIRENLAKCWQSAYKKGDLNESVAYDLAKLPEDDQKRLHEALKITGRTAGWYDAADIKAYKERLASIDRCKCQRRGRKCECQNDESKKMLAACLGRWESFHCAKCCSSCPDLISCKYACPVMADKVKKLKADKREAQKQVREAQAEKDRPAVEKVSALWQRFGLAREMAGKTFDECKRALGINYFAFDAEKVMKLECGEAKVSPDTKLPYNYSCYLSDVERLISLADMFGCSIDYLLCRTDIKEMAQAVQPSNKDVSNSGTGWKTGDPEVPGDYILMLQPYKGSLQFELWHWEDDGWEDDIGEYNQDIDGEILGWIPMPPRVGENADWNNHSCITGMSPTGHCGAAACCDTEHTCCLQCPDPCNSQCGWIEDQVEVLADE